MISNVCVNWCYVYNEIKYFFFHTHLQNHLQFAIKNKTLSILKNYLIFENALLKKHNMLQHLSYFKKKNTFFAYFKHQHQNIEIIMTYHMSLKTSYIYQLSESEEWLHKSFNICFLMKICEQSEKIFMKIIIRFLLLYKTDERHFSENTNEKIQYETAIYIWIKNHCFKILIFLLWEFILFNECRICC